MERHNSSPNPGPIQWGSGSPLSLCRDFQQFLKTIFWFAVCFLIPLSFDDQAVLTQIKQFQQQWPTGLRKLLYDLRAVLRSPQKRPSKTTVSNPISPDSRCCYARQLALVSIVHLVQRSVWNTPIWTSLLIYEQTRQYLAFKESLVKNKLYAISKRRNI